MHDGNLDRSSGWRKVGCRSSEAVHAKRNGTSSKSFAAAILTNQKRKVAHVGTIKFCFSRLLDAGAWACCRDCLLQGRISREPIMVARAHWDALLFLSQLPSQTLLARDRPTHGSLPSFSPQ